MFKNFLIFSVISLFTVTIVLGLDKVNEYKEISSSQNYNAYHSAEEEQNEITTEMTTEVTTEYAAKIKEAEISVVGDLMVHEWQINNAYDKNTASYNFEHTFESVYKYLQNADLTVGNLETVLGGKERGYTGYPCFNTPDTFLDALKKAGFDVLTTANNHSMDKGVDALLRTIDVLDNNGMGHFGTYKSQQDRDSVFIKDVNGIKIAFVSATYGVNGIHIPEDKNYVINILSEKLITEDIKRAKSENPDFIIVMPHMGNEYESYPRDDFKNLIDSMIRAGADAVLASHPHVLQPMEYRTAALDDGTSKTAFVTYSLANFVSSQRTVPRDTGVIVNLKLSKKDDEKAEIVQTNFIPTWVQWRDTSGDYNIRVLSIYDALNDVSMGNNTYSLRNEDISRLKKAQEEATYTITGKTIGSDNIQEKYTITEGNGQ